MTANEGRIEKFLKELQALERRPAEVEARVVMKCGRFASPEEALGDGAPWQAFERGRTWGGRYAHAWFHVEAEIGEDAPDCELAAEILTGQPNRGHFAAVAQYAGADERPWDIMNPQFVVYVDGELDQGADANHRVVALGPCARGKRVLDFSAYGGANERLFFFECNFFTRSGAVRALRVDVEMALECARRLEEHDARRIAMIESMQRAVDRVPLHLAGESRFSHAVADARALLEEEVYGRLGGLDEPSALCVGHTHIDIGWLWTVEQTREKALRSFSTVVKLMQHHPNYVFMSSQPQLYQFVKEDAPELYQKIRSLIREGRWEPEGAAWVEPDCNLISGESLVRQLLYGKRFFHDEFGHESRIMWLPDVFGYSASMPQILKKADVDYFLTSKISWNRYNKLPCDAFWWKGIDGTEILSYFLTARHPSNSEGDHYTTYNGDLIPYAIEGGWRRFQQKEISSEILIAYGYGDGGGGPSERMLENATRLGRGLPGCPVVRMGTALSFFKRLEQSVGRSRRVPKWCGELYLENHQGTYTSMAAMKRLNRLCEQALQEAELWCVVAGLGAAHPANAGIRADWPTLLTNQFHDILPGTCIREVYERAIPELEGVAARCGKAVQTALRALSNPGEDSIVVFNGLARERDERIEFPIPQALKGGVLVLSDADGSQYPCVPDRDGTMARAFVKNIPPAGWKRLRLLKAAADPDAVHMHASAGRLENGFFLIEFDGAGAFTRFLDKRYGRELIKAGERGNVLAFFEDRPEKWDAWNIEPYADRKCYGPDEVSVEALECDALTAAVCVKSVFHRSIFREEIRLSADRPLVELSFTVDWRESGMLAKLVFPLDINADCSTGEIAFGCAKRSLDSNTSWQQAQYELCAHRWMDVSEGGYGVSFLNDCKYGFDAKDGVVRLSLIKAGRAPFPGVDKGEHRFSYAVFPHPEGWERAGTVGLAMAMNRPVRVLDGAAAGADAFSFVRCDAENVVVDTVKYAEDDNGTILRLYEAENRRSRFSLRFARRFSRISTCDLLERSERTLARDADSVELEIKPFEIVSLRLEG